MQLFSTPSAYLDPADEVTNNATTSSYQSKMLSARRAISGTLPEPLLSRRPYGLNQITVELYRVSQLDLTEQLSEHAVSVLLRGSVNLLQRRNGKASRRMMHPGDIVVTPAGEPKLWRHEEEAEVLVLRLAPSYLRQIIEEADTGARQRVDLLDNFSTRDSQIEHLAMELLAECQTEGFAGRLYVESLTDQLAIHLLRHYSTATAAAEDSSGKLPLYKLRRVTDYIDENLREDLTLDKIANAVAMSRCHFAHVFKQTTGLAPHRYVIHRRIEQAKSLLRETELPITEIANWVGCSSQSHFSVLFHRVTSKTPGQYRRET